MATAASQAGNDSTAAMGSLGPQGFLVSQTSQIFSLPTLPGMFETLILSPFHPLDLLRSTEKTLTGVMVLE